MNVNMTFTPFNKDPLTISRVNVTRELQHTIYLANNHRVTILMRLIEPAEPPPISFDAARAASHLNTQLITNDMTCSFRGGIPIQPPVLLVSIAAKHFTKN